MATIEYLARRTAQTNQQLVDLVTDIVQLTETRATHQLDELMNLRPNVRMPAESSLKERELIIEVLKRVRNKLARNAEDAEADQAPEPEPEQAPEQAPEPETPSQPEAEKPAAKPKTVASRVAKPRTKTSTKKTGGK